MRKKLFVTGILFLLMSTGAYAAAVGPLAPSVPSSAQTPGSVQMPTIPNNPTTPAVPDIQGGSGRGIDFSGVDAIQREANQSPENIDLTRGDALLENQNPNQIESVYDYQEGANQQGTQGTQGTQGQNILAEPTEAEINDYFDQILFARTPNANPMGQLLRRLPRYGMSFFRRAPSTFAPRESVPVTVDHKINVGDTMTLGRMGRHILSRFVGLSFVLCAYSLGNS